MLRNIFIIFISQMNIMEHSVVIRHWTCITSIKSINLFAFKQDAQK